MEKQTAIMASLQHKSTLCLMAIIMVMLAISPIYAQKAKRFKDWNLSQYQQKFEESGQSFKTCNLWSVPTKSKGKYTRRGDIYFHITHLHSKETSHYNIISVEMGYPLHDAKKNKLVINIDKKKSKTYVFNKDGEIGTLDPKHSDKIIADMKKGNRLYISGVSTRGTKTSDEFSLSGFTKAHQQSLKECK